MKEIKDWNFITNHGFTLLYISQHTRCTARDMAPVIEATERTVHRVLIDSERQGCITRRGPARVTSTGSAVSTD